MDRDASGPALLDLGAAAETVGQDQGLRSSGPDGGQENPFGAGHGDVIVAGFEAEVPGQAAAARVEDVQVDPGVGQQAAVRACGSTDATPWQYLDQSTTTAALQDCPARLVPPPRETTGTPCWRHTVTAVTPASTVRGTTTPTGTWR